MDNFYYVYYNGKRIGKMTRKEDPKIGKYDGIYYFESYLENNKVSCYFHDRNMLFWDNKEVSVFWDHGEKWRHYVETHKNDDVHKDLIEYTMKLNLEYGWIDGDKFDGYELWCGKSNLSYQTYMYVAVFDVDKFFENVQKVRFDNFEECLNHLTNK